ncbi:pinin [Dermatophagoides farinae]|uniref:Pinin-like protein n=1 Tax=Dermatophagoides farinae TaxID=6954 RepID=A0A922HGV4_DERFA|nr:pinin-like [Dermatophagoides farinae]KAH7640050.1 pinin-like protein [Dermatophagoides farinae]KAH9493398.1 hypothetical protein DERF_014149 [Dermatophagoides farinae]
MTKQIMNIFGKLESEYETIQKSLTVIDDSIKKITGKDPGRIFDEKIGRNRFRSSSSSSFAIGNKRKLNEFDDNDIDHFDNHHDDDDDSPYKRSLQSQVVATSWEMKHRNQVLEEQKNDKKSMSRNRRMFGHILGTLEKFKNEQSQRKDLQKRAEIEQKLDQAAEQEREALKKEREKLFKERKSKRLQMKCLEMKLQRAEIHKKWEQSQQYLGNFIETKTKPNIFYMPTKHNAETMKRSQETKDKYRIIFAEKRAKIHKELNEIDEMYRMNNDEESGTGVVGDGNDVENQSHHNPPLHDNDDKNRNKSQDNNDDSKKNGHFVGQMAKESINSTATTTNVDGNASNSIKIVDEKITEEIKSKEQKNLGHHHHQHHHHHHHHHHHPSKKSLKEEPQSNKTSKEQSQPQKQVADDEKEKERKLIDKEDFEPDYD